jgi:hypothetical protein
MKEAKNTFAGVKAEVEETIEQIIPDFNDNA